MSIALTLVSRICFGDSGQETNKGTTSSESAQQRVQSKEQTQKDNQQGPPPQQVTQKKPGFGSTPRASQLTPPPPCVRTRQARRCRRRRRWRSSTACRRIDPSDGSVRISGGLGQGNGFRVKGSMLGSDRLVSHKWHRKFSYWMKSTNCGKGI